MHYNYPAYGALYTPRTIQKAGTYMRNRVLRNAPHVQFSLVMLLTLITTLIVAGCGGGTGSVPTVPTSDPNLATVTGIITDTTASSTPVQGALVTVAGTSLKATTGADGRFAITNVPVGAVGINVVTPSLTSYYSVVLYGPSGSQKQYNTSACPIALTTQASKNGTSPLPYPLQLYPAGINNPPPPPIGSVNPSTGCPN